MEQKIKIESGALPYIGTGAPLLWKAPVEVREFWMRSNALGHLKIGIKLAYPGAANGVVTAAEGPDTPEGLAYIFRALADGIVQATLEIQPQPGQNTSQSKREEIATRLYSGMVEGYALSGHEAALAAADEVLVSPNRGPK